jgi:hypothetical protein
VERLDELATQWGVDQHSDDGKTIWFEMDDFDPDPSDRPKP